MSEQDSMTGKVLGGRYEIGERIGAGGMAEDYSAQDSVLGRVVAVKVMLSKYAEEEDFARRFRQEAAAAANLQSPYIVNVYDWGHDLGTYYIVMEYVRGSDLKSAIKQRGAINQRKVAEVGAQVCQALSVAHAQDIVHRDVKPQNIMVQPDGNIKVMDFGIARAKNSVSEKTGNVLGTAHYISPEQAQGKELSAATDIYSLGVVMYEAATGQLPFDGPDAMSVAMMQVQDEPILPSVINPDIDPAFESIIIKAMCKRPEDRFATANELKMALNDFLAGRSNPSFTSAATSVLPAAVAGAGIAGAAMAGAGQAGGATQVMAPVNGAGQSYEPSASTYSQNNTADKKMSGKKKAGIAFGVLVAIAAIAAACWFAFGQGDKIDVPDVTGMTTEQASQAIKAAGFEVGNMESVYDTSTEAGKVISQNPKSGDSASKGSKINLVVSQGTEQVEVPDVTGKTSKDAQAALVKAGFAVGTTTEESSDKVKEGNVISQDPAGGQNKPKGSSVNLVVSKGADSVTIPNLIGLTADQARTTASNYGFTVYQSGSQSSDTVAEGNIISQSPQAGTQAKKGDSIGYVISEGKSQVEVPNVVGYTQSGAKSAIESAGLVCAIQTDYSSTVAEGNVISCSPKSGSKVASGSTVTITVSLGSQSSNSSSSSGGSGGRSGSSN